MLACIVALAPLAAAALDQATIDNITGLKGTLNQEENVYKVTVPRGDLGVKVDDWTMPAFMGLTTWAAFTDGKGKEAMVMGDLVLLEDEVNPVMSVLFDADLSVTALHNHFLHQEPAVYFMHIGGEGTADSLAKGVRAALDKVKEIRATAPHPASSFGGDIPAKSSITAAPLAEVLGGKAQEKDGMVKFVFGRSAEMECGCKIGKEMGLNTWAAFAGTDDNAVVDGDFACQEKELQPVLKKLRAGGINIVAIWQHMTGESPHYCFFHYWGRGKAADLAGKIKSSLDLLAK